MNPGIGWTTKDSSNLSFTPGKRRPHLEEPSNWDSLAVM